MRAKNTHSSIVMIKFSCYLNATLSIIRQVLFMNFFYEYHWLWLAYPYLFVCVRWSYNVCFIQEHMILQIILACSRLTRGWGVLGSFKLYTINYVIFFYCKCYWKFFTKWRCELCNL